MLPYSLVVYKQAELRASVFLTLEEQDAGRKNSPFVNEELKKYLATKEGRIILLERE